MSIQGKREISKKLKLYYSDPAKHPQYKGGRIKRGSYWYVLKKDHPFSQKSGYIAEHRIVMEKKLNRYLKPSEAVHHRDGNPENNSPENLEVCSSHGMHTKIWHPEVAENTKIRFIGRKPKNYNKVEHKCENCGNIFLKNPNRKPKFCSIECYWKNKKGRPSPFPEGLKKGWGWNKGLPSTWNLKGKDHPNYKSGKYSQYI